MLEPPTSYQGGKQRIAAQILDIISPQDTFNDLCCGSGAISIELINRGYDPSKIHMLDIGPWGLVWQMVGKGTFDINHFAKIIEKIPDKYSICDYLKNLSKQDVSIDTPYVFLLLQAGSFGSKAIWIKGNKWQNCSFRRYWEPTETSNRRSPVNPMMPMPETLLKRMELICKTMKGVNGHYTDIVDYKPSGTVYIDPPYENTTFYGNNFKLNFTNCWVSEGRPLSNKSYLISMGRRKGGISGKRTIKPAEEWLSYIT